RSAGSAVLATTLRTRVSRTGAAAREIDAAKATTIARRALRGMETPPLTGVRGVFTRTAAEGQGVFIRTSGHGLGLQEVKGPVQAAVARQQLLVAPGLAHLAVVEDEDPVGVLDRREAVRDDDGGAPDEQRAERLLDLTLGL